ncbi:MAG: hypothetical protein SWQ30_15665 [Thermodesulfobacteriota bacterium]|nr:hypothetical protein [Thermodesulfobacteriota bacterium]
MKKQRQSEKDGLIVTYFCGLHTYEDAVEALNELLEMNRGAKQIYEIVINEADMKLNFTRAEEQLITDKAKATFENFERGALAVVANHDVIFGLSRMLATTIENDQIAVSVFRTEGLAREWIQEMREMHDQAFGADGQGA